MEIGGEMKKAIKDCVISLRPCRFQTTWGIRMGLKSGVKNGTLHVLCKRGSPFDFSLGASRARSAVFVYFLHLRLSLLHVLSSSVHVLVPFCPLVAIAFAQKGEDMFSISCPLMATNHIYSQWYVHSTIDVRIHWQKPPCHVF